MKKLKLLIVDDYIDNRRLLAQIAEVLDYDYVLAENGRKAFDILEQTPDFDIVFMDIEMPVMNGIETTVKIRKTLTEPTNKIPIVAITAHNPEDFRDKLQSKGFSAYISKPYTLDKVEGVINQQLKNG